MEEERTTNEGDLNSYTNETKPPSYDQTIAQPPVQTVHPQQLPSVQPGSSIAQPVPPVNVPYTSNVPVEPKLTFVDFIPDGPSSRYPELVEKANCWLATNLAFRLHSCETISVPVKQGAICVHNSVNHIPVRSGSEYTSVLRCWLIKADSPPVVEPQVIGTITCVPEKKRNLTMTLGVGQLLQVNAQMHDMCASQTECLEQLNQKLKVNPLPGKILRVETVKMKVTESMSQLMNFDPDVLYWTEGNLGTLFLNYIRVFYMKGQPANEQIGWNDIIPSYELNRSNYQRPRFEPFSITVTKAGQWAHIQTDKRIVNMQTIDIQLIIDTVLPVTARRPIINTTKSTMYYSQRSGGAMLRYLRIYHVTSDSIRLERPYWLTQRSFLPYRLTTRQFEQSTDNVRRLGTWLAYNFQNASSNENDIICAETVEFPTKLHVSDRPIDSDANTYPDMYRQGHDIVYGIRLYMNGVYYEPPAEILGIPLTIIPGATSECCTIA